MGNVSAKNVIATKDSKGQIVASNNVLMIVAEMANVIEASVIVTMDILEQIVVKCNALMIVVDMVAVKKIYL